MQVVQLYRLACVPAELRVIMSLPYAKMQRCIRMGRRSNDSQASQSCLGKSLASR